MVRELGAPLKRFQIVIGLVAVSSIAVSGSLVGAAGATSEQSTASRAKHDRTVAFWTHARVAKATPRDFVFDPASKSFKPTANLAGSGSSTVKGTSWTAGGEVLRTTGKVLFAMGSSYYVCSASVVDDTVAGRSIILTAAHCAYDEVAKAFATNWLFIPDYDSAPEPLTTSGSFCASTAFGCWTASALVVHNGYASAGGFNTQATTHDFAFAVVEAGGKSGTSQLDTSVGGHPIKFSTVASNTNTHLFGYPAAGNYYGYDLVYCRGSLGSDTQNAKLTYKVACNMTGGSSGGPWFAPFVSGSGTLMSVNSYTYQGGSSMYGPKFNTKTAALFSTAATAVANTIVS